MRLRLARFDEGPPRLRHGTRALAAGAGGGVVGRARDHASHDALGDGGQAKHGEGHVKAPVGNVGAPDAAAIRGEVISLARDAEGIQVLAEHAAQDVRAQMIRHGVVGKVGQGVPEGGQLPVEHGEHPRLCRMHDDIAQAEIAVDDRGLIVGGNVLGQPDEQMFHGLDALGLRGAILLGPAVDLSREVAPRPAEVRQAQSLPVLAMQPREHVVHGIVDGRALGRRAAGQKRIDHDAAAHPVHHVEDRPNDLGILAEHPRLRHGHVGLAEGGEDAILAIHRVRGGQEFARRLAPQHVLVSRGGQAIGRVGLATLELAHRDGPAEAVDVLGQIALERGHVEAMRLPHGNGVGGERGLDGH